MAQLDEILDVLARTGTGQTKINLIGKELNGIQKLDAKTAQKKLEGKIPAVTLEKVVTWIEHGVPELEKVTEVDTSQFATIQQLKSLQATVTELQQLIEAKDDKIEAAEGKAALAIDRVEVLEQLLQDASKGSTAKQDPPKEPAKK